MSTPINLTPHPRAESQAKKPPLCVDLDGTLLHTDTLFELLLVFLKRQPGKIFHLIAWLFRGKAFFKEQLSLHVQLPTSSLPIRQPLLEYLQEEAANGRSIFLATAANRRVAEQILADIPLFKGYFASDRFTNLAGDQKLRELTQQFGPKGFEYAGDSTRDLAVWRGSAGAIVVGSSARLMKTVERIAPVVRVFSQERHLLVHLIRQMRVYQWVKNTLIFLPLIGAHRVFDPWAVGQALLAFVSFSLCASAVYTVNDLTDLAADRAHPEKKTRPLAAGDLSPLAAIWLATVLFAASLATSALVSPGFTALVGFYILLTFSYSLGLKRYPVLDVLVLAGLYTTRVFGGELATGIPVSEWLLTFSMFVFLSLALLKRYAELRSDETASPAASNGRGYRLSDTEAVAMLGGAAGYLAVLVFALYINSDAVKIHYSYPRFLWLVIPLLLYWTSRMWLLAGRGEMTYDPILFSFKDRPTYAVGLMIMILLFLAGPLSPQG
ncbi:MAG TPA: UbiA family prenyltransferase [Acidobacteriota bacterium]|nr:UbiA family prenyltransferase [Acidobacteriota bacterium]